MNIIKYPRKMKSKKIQQNQKKIKKEKTKMLKDVEMSAASLYDGGWRAEDREQLIAEYQLTEDEADAICEKLQEYED